MGDNNLTVNAGRVMGVLDQAALSGAKTPTDANVSDAIRVIGSLAGTNIAQNKVFSIAYSIARKFGLTSKLKFFDLGVPDEVLTSVPSQYLIRLTTTSQTGNYQCVVTAVIQDKIQFRTASSWKNIVPEFASEAATALSQVAGFSLASSIASRRIWTGTEPLRTTIRFKFEAYRDAQKEVVLPTMVLQQLALPGRNNVTKGAELFLIPPGPSPFPEVGKAANGAVNSIVSTLNNLVGTNLPLQKWSTTGEETTIQIGTFLTFNRVVVEDIEVIYDNTRSNIMGDPIGAEAKVTFSTYEIMTKESLEGSFNNVSIHKDAITGAVKNLASRVATENFGV